MDGRAPVRAAPPDSPVASDPVGPNPAAVDPAAVDPAAVDPAASASRRPSVAVRVLVAVLRFYRRWVSPMLPPSCRFHPTCSAYGVEALRTHGVVIGAGLTLVRVAKCAPWHPGGLDPVPPREHRTWCGWPRRAADPGGEAPHTEEREPC